MSSRSNGDSFTYDANGNMTVRTMDGSTWNQTFDAENRLVSVAGGGTTTTYVYDGSGGRVKRIVNDGSSTVTTVYVAGMEIELHGSTEDHRTIYYPAGGAFRVIGGTNPGLYFRHGDHLGSTSVLSDSSGNKVADSDVVFAPYGEVRTGELSTLTDFGFTGQRLDRSTDGLMYYGARYYLPGLNRFISADTIVARPSNPQYLNRFAYAGNNPVRYIDPTGHMYEDDGDGKGGCNHNCGGGDDGGGDDGGGNDGGSEGTNPINPDPDNSGGHHRSSRVKKVLEDLAAFGVSIVDESLDQFSDDEQFAMATVIKTTVETLATNAADIIQQVSTQTVSGTFAFMMTFGATTINLVKTDAGDPYVSGKSYGWNHRPGGFIDLSSYVLMNGGPMKNGTEISGAQLVAHELSHNITWRDYDHYDPVINTGDVILNYPEGLGVLAGNYDIDRDPTNGTQLAPEEITADAIASWGLNDFTGEYADVRRQDVLKYMRWVIRCEISDPRGHSCPI